MVPKPLFTLFRAFNFEYSLLMRSSNNLKILLAGLLVLLSSGVTTTCGADQVLRTIDTMGFRGVAEDDPLLGQKFIHKEAFYSIRPPGEWKLNPKAHLGKPLLYGTRFENPKTGDFLTVGLIQGGPSVISIETLSRFRGDFLSTLRKQGLGQIVGSDLFHFSHYTCLQIMVKDKGRLVLQLLIFDQPGTFIQLVFSIGKNRYHSLSRAVETSITSFEWPNL